MSILDNFTAFNFNEGAPYVSVTKNGVTFNKGVVMKMKYPEHVLLLIDAEGKRIALQACSEDTPNATSFCSPDKKEGPILSIRWNGRDLLNTLRDMMGWDYTKESYKAEGKLIPEENAIIFELNNATKF